MDSNGDAVFSEVFMFLDRDEDQLREFVRIETDGGAGLTVTPSHLLLIWHAKNDAVANYKFADQIEIGDYVLVNFNNILKPRKVINITNELHRGVYAPLTYDGTIIVNSITASCYALVVNHNYAHMSFMPMRALHTIEHMFSDSIDNNVILPRGIHWYANALSKIKNICLPSKWFYQT